MFDLFRKQLTAIRFEATTLSENGNFLPPISYELIFKASVQPTPAEEMQMLEEGYRTKDSFTLYTDFELKTTKRDFLPDLVVIDGEKFEVIKVAKWQNNLIPHYEVIVIRVDRDDVNQ